MRDLLYKGHFKESDIAFVYAVTTATVNETVMKHDCDPVAAHLLGRAMTGALMGAAVLPEKQRLNVCWRYDGELRTIVADAGSDGTVRAFVSPTRFDEVPDVNALYGDSGTLRVIASEDGIIRNSGTTEIRLQDVVHDLAYFFCVSNQVETGMTVMIGFNADEDQPVSLCQGWMLQALPGCDLELFDRVRRRMDSERFRSMMGHLNNADGYFEELAGELAGEEIAHALHMDTDGEPRFRCRCKRDKIVDVICSIPIPDRMNIVKRGEPVVVSCQFCNRRFEVSIEECIAAWNRKTGQKPEKA